MELSATVTRRMPAASVLAAVLCTLTLLASPPSASASNLKTRVWDFFEDCTLCTDGEGDLSRRSSSGKAASWTSDCGGRNLFYNRFRYYDPAVGRYVSPDPIGLVGGVNVYAFATNTTGFLDPYGLAKKKNKGGCEGTTKKAGSRVPDSEIIVMGSNNKPGNFILRSGVDDRAIGGVTAPGKSASIATDLTPTTEIQKMFGRAPKRGDTLSGAFVEDVRAAGFDVVYAPTASNPDHVRIVAGARGFDESGREWLSASTDRLARVRK